MAVLAAARLRQTGEQRPGVLSSATSWARAVSLLDAQGEVVLASEGMVKCLALDNVDERLLLTVDSNARVSLFDCAAPRPAQPPQSVAGQDQWTPIAHYSSDESERRRGSSASSIPCHTKIASAVAWFTGDTGLFITGGFDGRVIAWDTLRFEPAFAWAVGHAGSSAANIYAVATSRIAASHALVAVACGDSRVRLVDLATCSATHMLGGSADAGGPPIVSVAWAPTHEYVLASGGADGTVQLWDVRRSGAAALLAVADPLAAPPPPPSTAGGASDSSAGAMRQGFGVSAAANPVTAAPGGVAGLSHGGAVNAVHFAWAGSTSGGAGAPVGPVAPPHMAGLGAAQALGAAACLLSYGSDSLLRAWSVQTGSAAPLFAAAELRIPRRASSSVGGQSSSSSSSSSPASAPPADVLTHEPLAVRVLPLPRAYAGLSCRRTLAVHLATAPYGRFAHAVFTPCATSSAGIGGVVGGRSAALAGRGPGVIAVHALESGERLGELHGHTGPVNGVWFRSAAQELFSCGDDGLVLRWEPPLLQRARPGAPQRDEDDDDGGADDAAMGADFDDW